MKKMLFILLCISCAAGHKIMTEETFAKIENGMKENSVKKIAGKPYEVKNIGDGVYEYQYIERIFSGDRVIEVRKYLILMKNGVVTSKKMTIEKGFDPLQERNSYDLQTSGNLK